jgi:hypothetical protein
VRTTTFTWYTQCSRFSRTANGIKKVPHNSSFSQFLDYVRRSATLTKKIQTLALGTVLVLGFAVGAQAQTETTGNNAIGDAIIVTTWLNTALWPVLRS